MNQSEQIRSLVLEIFKTNNYDSIKQTIIVDGIKRKGIKYIDLKKFLLDFDNGVKKFSEGAVTGALYTLTERLEDVYKTKTRNGVFFFYSDNEGSSFENNDYKMSITESEDFSSLEDKVETVSAAIADILKNVSKEKYLEVHDIDLKYLRELLKVSGDLQNALSRYKTEKTFKKIESNNLNGSFDNLPF